VELSQRVVEQGSTSLVSVPVVAAAGGLVGVLLGAVVDEKERVRGALIGGLVGVFSGVVVGFLASGVGFLPFQRRRLSILEITRDSEGRIISMVERETYE
jgi:hypothetical protein